MSTASLVLHNKATAAQPIDFNVSTAGCQLAGTSNSCLSRDGSMVKDKISGTTSKIIIVIPKIKYSPLIRRETLKKAVLAIAKAASINQVYPGMYRPKPIDIQSNSHQIPTLPFDRVIKTKQASGTTNHNSIILAVPVRAVITNQGVVKKIKLAKRAIV